MPRLQTCVDIVKVRSVVLLIPPQRSKGILEILHPSLQQIDLVRFGGLLVQGLHLAFDLTGRSLNLANGHVDVVAYGLHTVMDIFKLRLLGLDGRGEYILHLTVSLVGVRWNDLLVYWLRVDVRRFGRGDKFEDLERVGCFGRGCCKAEKVVGGQEHLRKSVVLYVILVAFRLPRRT